jgi:hypothetical protein
MQEVITFQDYVKIQIFLKDKNSAYQYCFFAAGCDVTKMSEVYTLDEKVIKQNVDYWIPTRYAVAKHYDEIGGAKVRKCFELTTEEWMNLSNIIENSEHVEQSFYSIISVLTGLDIVTVQSLPYLEPANEVCFFFQNLQNFTENLTTFLGKNLKIHLN